MRFWLFVLLSAAAAPPSYPHATQAEAVSGRFLATYLGCKQAPVLDVVVALLALEGEARATGHEAAGDFLRRGHCRHFDAGERVNLLISTTTARPDGSYRLQVRMPGRRVRYWTDAAAVDWQ